jgi:hypothetical protein
VFQTYQYKLLGDMAERIMAGNFEQPLYLNGYEAVFGLKTLSCRYNIDGVGWTVAPNRFLPFVGFRADSSVIPLTGNSQLDRAISSSCKLAGALPEIDPAGTSPPPGSTITGFAKAPCLFRTCRNGNCACNSGYSGCWISCADGCKIRRC